MKPIETAIEYFTESELACKGSGVIKLDPRFAFEVVALRRAFGESMSVIAVAGHLSITKK